MREGGLFGHTRICSRRVFGTYHEHCYRPWGVQLCVKQTDIPAPMKLKPEFTALMPPEVAQEGSLASEHHCSCSQLAK